MSLRWADSAGNVGSASSQVVVSLYGDLNLDGVVDPSDMVILRAYFNFVVRPGNPPWTGSSSLGDLNHDRVIDPTDLVLLRAFMNMSVACLAP